MNRKPQTIAFWCGRLPHWEVEDGRYFITLHLAGAIPAVGRKRVQAIADDLRRIDSHQSPGWLRVQRAVFAEMERWLDRAPRNASLRRPEVAETLMSAIDHRQARGDWNVFEYVVMPTHIHLFCEIGRRGLKKTMEEFKRWTGHRAMQLQRENRSLPAEGTYRFWQREWFDHWSRSDEEDERIVAYIRNNPVKAGLVHEYLQWPYASWK